MTGLPARMSERLLLAEPIGRGSCSTVFRAHDRLLDRDVAVKTFPVADDPRARREVALLASLDHPGLVPVYDIEQADGHAYVVTALFDGSLADRIAADGPLPVGSALLTAATIAEALAHVHRRGVLHRDVVPRNILFDADGRAHLSDFGVAVVADAPRLTDTGVVVGSAPYLAPELLRGGTAGPTSDVYSLGLVLIEALTGRRAYEGPPLEAAEARLTRRPPTPTGVGPDVVATLEAMTADEPGDRPAADVTCVRLRRAALAAETPTPERGLRAALVPMVATPPGGVRVEGASRSVARYGRSAVVLAAAAVSIMVAGSAVVASAWPVHSVSATTPPAASAAAPAPAVLPLLAQDAGADSEGSHDRAVSDDSGSGSSGSGSSGSGSSGSGSSGSGSSGSGSSGSGSSDEIQLARDTSGSSGSSQASRASSAAPSPSAAPRSTSRSWTPKAAPKSAPKVVPPARERSAEPDDAADSVRTVRDRVQDRADDARDRVQDRADDARDRVQDRADTVRERLGDTTDDPTDRSEKKSGKSTDSDEDSSSSTTTTSRSPGLLDPAVQALEPVTGLLGH